MATPLTFPRATFAKLSPHPYLLANLQPQDPSAAPARPNGRAPHQARMPHVNTSSLSHAHGSAVVRSGDTTVVCGVRGEILPVTSIPQYRPREADYGGGSAGQEKEKKKRLSARELADYDLLVPNIELATGCAPQFLPGGPPTTLAQSLSTRVYSLLHGAGVLDAADLRIWRGGAAAGEKGSSGGGDDERMADADNDEQQTAEGEEPAELVAYWVLYIDVLFVSFDGNPFDTAWAAVVAALRDTKLPRAYWSVDREMVLCSRKETRALTIYGLPVAFTAAVFLEKEHGANKEGKHWVLADPDRLEESLCDETVTVVVDCSGGQTRIRSLSKHGGVVVGPALLKELLGLAEIRWEASRKALG